MEFHDEWVAKDMITLGHIMKEFKTLIRDSAASGASSVPPNALPNVTHPFGFPALMRFAEHHIFLELSSIPELRSIFAEKQAPCTWEFMLVTMQDYVNIARQELARYGVFNFGGLFELKVDRPGLKRLALGKCPKPRCRKLVIYGEPIPTSPFWISCGQPFATLVENMVNYP